MLKVNTAAVLDEPENAEAREANAEAQQLADECPFETPGDASAEAPADSMPVVTAATLADLPLDGLYALATEAATLIGGCVQLRKVDKPPYTLDVFQQIARKASGFEFPPSTSPGRAETWVKDLQYEVDEEIRRRLAAAGEEPAAAKETANEEEPASEPESDAEILARLAREWEAENAELDHDISRLGVEILKLGDQKKALEKDRKELTEKLADRLNAGPPRTIPMHQRPLPFDQQEKSGQGSEKAEGESGQEEAVATDPPELDWSLDGEDVYVAESRHVFTEPVDELNYTPRALLWAIDGNDEDGYALDDSHERLLVDTGLVGVKFATMEDAQKAAAIADHSHAKPAAASAASAASSSSSSAPADPNAPEDLRWRDVKLAKWPKPHNLAAGTLKMLEEAGLETLGQVTDWTSAGKKLTDIKGFGEGKLQKFEEAETAFWARWKRDPEKVVREEV